jgi:glycerol-3-phosphate acyltransferase PlsY
VETTWFYAIWIVGAYLLGSLSTGDLVCRAAGVNIREWGTGNPGTANIFREMGPKYGVAVFLLDILKGAAATVPLWLLGIDIWARLLATLSLLLGQFFPVFWRFRGGTGMAAFFGTTAGLLPVGALIGLPAGFAYLGLTRNIGWSGGVFMFVAALSGGLILIWWPDSGDPVGVLAIALGGAAVFVRQVIQYRDTPPSDQRPHRTRPGMESAESRGSEVS